MNCRNVSATTFFCFGILVLAVGWYTVLPHSSFYSDDFDNIQISSMPISCLLALPQQQENPIPPYYYRPVPWVVYGAMHRMGMDTPPWQYAVNMAIHAANAVLVLLLMSSAGNAKPPRRNAATAIVLVYTAFIGFISSYSVLWVAQRFDLMAAFFVLLALYTASQWWNGKSTAFALLSILCALLAYGSKEIAYSLPALYIAWFLVQRNSATQNTASVKRALVLSVWSAMGLGVVFFLRWTYGVLSVGAMIEDISIQQMSITLVRGMYELIQPFRSISLYGLLDAGDIGAGIEILLAGAVFAGLYVFLIAGVSGKQHPRRAHTILLPTGILLIQMAIMGWVQPRILYLPNILLLTSLGYAILHSERQIQRGAVLCAFLLLVTNSAVAAGITTYYVEIQEHNQQMVYTAPPDAPYTVLCQEYNRQWHRQHSGEVFPVLYSEADPVFERIFTSVSGPRFSAVWHNDTTLFVSGNIPNRFFFVHDSCWKYQIAAGSIIRKEGCTIQVAATHIGGRPDALTIRFTRSWLTSHRLYVDNGAVFSFINASMYRK